MATTIYKSQTVYLFDGTELEIIPLKIKYLREFMQTFETIKKQKMMMKPWRYWLSVCGYA